MAMRIYGCRKMRGASHADYEFIAACHRLYIGDAVRGPFSIRLGRRHNRRILISSALSVSGRVSPHQPACAMGMSNAQLAALLTIVAGVILLIVARRRFRKVDPVPKSGSCDPAWNQETKPEYHRPRLNV